MILDSTDREHFHISESSIGQRCTKDIKMSRKEKTAGKEVKGGGVVNHQLPFPLVFNVTSSHVMVKIGTALQPWGSATPPLRQALERWLPYKCSSWLGLLEQDIELGWSQSWAWGRVIKWVKRACAHPSAMPKIQSG